jgi:hypothetical protein
VVADPRTNMSSELEKLDINHDTYRERCIFGPPAAKHRFAPMELKVTDEVRG